MAVVTFDPSAWHLLYPELAYVSDQQATQYFALACMLLDNTDVSPVPAGSPTFQRDTFLNVLVAHLAKLFASGGPVPPGQIVGRVSSATQGSVSIVTQLVNNPSDQMAFFMQTEYGLLYWTMSAQFRTGFYVPPPCPEPPGVFGVYNGTPGYMNPWPYFSG